MAITAAHDVQHCPRRGIKGHIVTREKMTYFWNDKGQKMRICTECLERIGKKSTAIKRSGKILQPLHLV